jgi:lycopene beta-cyclase
VLAWQKFLGPHLRLAEPHGLTEPVIMDASVPQIDGYRFVYLLPFDDRRLMVEDTYYSDGPALDAAALRARIDAYVLSRGWRSRPLRTRRTGSCPIALGGDMERFWAGAPWPAPACAPGLFHPTTGYSLPDAAAWPTRSPPRPTCPAPPCSSSPATTRWRPGARGFYRLLNRMLFRAAEPAQRWRVLQRFYGLPQPLVERFYAGRSTRRDAARI